MRTVLVLLLTAVAGCSGVADGGNNVVGHHSGDGGAGNGDGGGIELADMARDTTSCTGGGSACTSGNAGQCNVGIVTCNGTQAMCTPSSTVQSCYDGMASTAGVGICKTGTQSCIGALGPCEGEILPATKEDCTNDLDDDCNGTVNNSCPSGLSIGTPRLVAPYAGGNDANIANNMNLSVACAANAFVTAVSLYFFDGDQEVSGLRLGCSTVSLTRSGAGYVASLATAANAPALLAPNADGSGEIYVLTCSGSGMRGIWAAKGTYDAGGILGFFVQCGAATLTENSDNTLSIAMAATTGTANPTSAMDGSGFVGYDYATAANPPLPHSSATWTCNANEVVVGFNGNVSVCGSLSDGTPASCLDNIQPICGTITPTYL